MFEYKTIDMFEVSEKRLGWENMKWDFALGKTQNWLSSVGTNMEPLETKENIPTEFADPTKSDMNDIFNVWIV